jgi:hypothetical protein
MPCMGRPARPPTPSPVSQPAFKFKRFGVQFQNFCCSFFFSVADFFSRTKSFIDIDEQRSSKVAYPSILLLLLMYCKIRW